MAEARQVVCRDKRFGFCGARQLAARLAIKHIIKDPAVMTSAHSGTVTEEMKCRRQFF